MAGLSHCRGFQCPSESLEDTSVPFPFSHHFPIVPRTSALVSMLGYCSDAYSPYTGLGNVGCK